MSGLSKLASIAAKCVDAGYAHTSVSYTHLTLPTILLV